MQTITETVYVDAPRGRMSVEGHRPDSGAPLPGILVLMEAFGVNSHIRSVTRRLAAEGYVALPPELYYREGERTLAYTHTDRAADRVMRTIALSDAPEERVKDDRVLADICAGLGALAEHPYVDRARIGVMGFGMGGRLAFLTACRQSEMVRAAVIFYGERIIPVLSEARSLRAALLLLFGGHDPSIPLMHVDRIQAELSYLGKTHDVKIYPRAEHGFFCEERPAYNLEAAQDAWIRSTAWLAKHLA